MRSIYLKPYGGIGNRLLAINSAVGLKRELNFDELIVLWERNNELFAKYSDIFQESNDYKYQELEAFNWRKTPSYFQIYNIFQPTFYRFPLFNKLLGREKRFDQKFYNHPVNKCHIVKDDIKSGSKTIYIAAHDSFFNTNTNSFINFKLKQDIVKRIKGITSQFNEMTVGIHIRRKDSQWAIENSPDIEFITGMYKLAETGFNFFITSDDEDTEFKFYKMFEKSAIEKSIRKKCRNRFEMEGIIDSMIDLFCLSKTKRIYGSYHSTFGYVASKIGNIEFEVIKKGG